MDMGQVSSMAGLASLTTFIVSLRLYSRHITKQRFWWDDWLMIFALACNLGGLGVDSAMVLKVQDASKEGAPPLSAPEMTRVRKLLLASDMMYVSSLSLSKLSALLMQYRIFAVARHFKRWVWAIGTFVVAWWVVVFFLLIFTCWPVEKRWDASIPGSCPSRGPGSIANSVASIVGDVMLLMLPIPQIWKLQLRLTEKILLTLIFCLGVCIIFTSVARLIVFVHNEQGQANMSYSMIGVVGWSDVEMSTGIICACLPTFRPIITRISKARARLWARIRRKKTAGKQVSNSTSNNNNSSSSNSNSSNGSNSSGTVTVPSVCRHSLSAGSAGSKACHVCNTTAVDRLYYGADHDLYSILSMDDELSLEHTGDMAMSIMPFKHELGENVGTAV